MKLLIFLTLLTVANCYPIVKTWTLNELSEILEKSQDQEMRKYYIDALNIIMYALFTGKNEAAVHAIIQSPSGRLKWTLVELRTALEDPYLSKALKPFYERSYHYLISSKPDIYKDEVEVAIPALDISTWTLAELTDVLEDPDTLPALKAYLEHAKKEIKKGRKKRVTIITPVGLIHPSFYIDKRQPKIVAKVLADSDQAILPILSLLR